MEERQVEAKQRATIGTSASNQLRREGQLPAVLYGREKKAIALVVPEREITTILRSRMGMNTILTIKGLRGEKGEKILIKDYQLDPISQRLLHVDFIRVDPKRRVEMQIPIESVGVPIGVTEEEGILNTVLRTLRIRCHLDSIPESFAVDVIDLGMGDSLQVKDITVDDGIEILDNPEQTVVTITSPLEEIEVAVPEEEELEPELVGEEVPEEEVAKEEPEAPAAEAPESGEPPKDEQGS